MTFKSKDPFGEVEYGSTTTEKEIYFSLVFESQIPNPTSPQKDICEKPRQSRAEVGGTYA